MRKKMRERRQLVYKVYNRDWVRPKVSDTEGGRDSVAAEELINRMATNLALGAEGIVGLANTHLIVAEETTVS